MSLKKRPIDRQPEVDALTARSSNLLVGGVGVDAGAVAARFSAALNASGGLAAAAGLRTVDLHTASLPALRDVLLQRFGHVADNAYMAGAASLWDTPAPAAVAGVLRWAVTIEVHGAAAHAAPRLAAAVTAAALAQLTPTAGGAAGFTLDVWSQPFRYAKDLSRAPVGGILVAIMVRLAGCAGRQAPNGG